MLLQRLKDWEDAMGPATNSGAPAIISLAGSVFEFVRKYSLGTEAEQTKVLFEMFTAISPLAEGTPLVGSYFNRGVENRQVVLCFHKVLT